MVSTSGFDPVSLGSNPSTPANIYYPTMPTPPEWLMWPYINTQPITITYWSFPSMNQITLKVAILTLQNAQELLESDPNNTVVQQVVNKMCNQVAKLLTTN